jgi:hypothetical protein
VRAFQLIFQDICCHIILESFQCIFLGIDSFLSELVVPLVDAQYRRDYHIWKHRLDTNTRATDFLVDHAREGSFAHNQSSHRSSSAYSFCPYCQSCRSQVVEWIFQHISQLRWPHTTWRSLPKLF